MSALANTGALAALLPVVLWKATLVLGCAAFLCWLMRYRSAAARHLVWTVGLAAVLVLPLCIVALPAWRVAVLPVLPVMARQPLEEPASTKEAATAEKSRPGSPTYPEATVSQQPDATAAAPRITMSWQDVLFALWLTGAAAVLAWIATGYFAAWRFRRRAHPLADPAWSSALALAQRQLVTRRRVRLLEVEQSTSPMMTGLFDPAILLPGGAREWSDSRRRVVLLHELAHVKRADVLTQFVAQLACAVYWFHPLVWHAASRMRAERERACDDAVVSAGERASDYATHLLDVARSFRPARVMQPAALAMARASQLEGRLLALLKPGIDRGRITLARVVTSAGTALAVIVPLSVFMPTTRSAAARQPADEGPAVQSAQVIRHPDPAAPLADRWAWAFREAARRNPRRGYWIAYSIRRTGRPNETFMGGSDGFNLDELNREPLQTQLFGTRPVRFERSSTRTVQHDIALMMRFERGAFELDAAAQARHQSSGAGIDLHDLPVFWLGEASDRQSIAWVERQFRNAAPDWMRDELVEMIGLHSTAELAVPALERALEGAESSLRAEVAETLGDQGSPEAFRVLRDIIRTDRSPDVLREAVEALGEFQDDQATRLLLEIARNADDVEVGAEAAEALSAQRSPAAFDALSSIILGSAVDPRVQQQAVEALGEFGAEAADLLKRLALTHSRQVVRLEAAETLGELPPNVALPVLGEIIFGDASPHVQEEAVEALGDLGRGARRLLQRVAREHGNADVRAKAAEVIADMGDSER